MDNKEAALEEIRKKCELAIKHNYEVDFATSILNIIAATTKGGEKHGAVGYLQKEERGTTINKRRG